MAEHEHGTMDSSTQEKTFEGFMTFVTRTVIFLIVLLVLMAIFIG
ncbi:aa3-type cytochrome c oxidase subunit IV [Sulfitobacter aestuarii]|uniref:Aa3-type cytochrome c oxidase subunit IV n=1 Tax=Sulfitobacter aestuarii TaxID=2161676 RepID=A0ABW5U2U6_9RHOB